MTEASAGGPARPATLLRGREMIAVHPYVPLAGTVQVGIAMFSYRGTLSFGVTGGGDRARDVDVVAATIDRALHELVEAATVGPRLRTIATAARGS